jgi:4-azaleucine resistance transporter AzlC
MYAGAGQYVAVGLFASGAGLATILITMLMVNIRHIVYGLSLISKFKSVGKWKYYLIFALTDETYALLTSCSLPQGAQPGPFYGSIALLDQLYWILGSIVGALAGTLIPFSFEGIDFALTALFAVLLIDQLKKTHDILPPLIGIASAVAALCIVPAENMLIVALAVGIAVLVLVRGRNLHSSGRTDK